MSDVKDLYGPEAISKMKELINNINICMFCTNIPDIPFNTRPMSTQEVDEEGCIWFLSSASSNKNFEIREDEDVQLIYAGNSNAHFLTVYGKASLSYDRKKAAEIWNVAAKAWFKEGVDDPDLSVIRVKPEYAYYWTTKQGKIVSMIRILTAIVSNKVTDEGIEGVLEVKA